MLLTYYQFSKYTITFNMWVHTLYVKDTILDSKNDHLITTALKKHSENQMSSFLSFMLNNNKA